MCLLQMFTDDSTLIYRAWHLQWDCSSRLHPKIQWILLVTCNLHNVIRQKDRCRVVKNHLIGSTTTALLARKACSMDPGRTIVSSTVPYRYYSSIIVYYNRMHLNIKYRW